jgi:hypothetical protein
LRACAPSPQAALFFTDTPFAHRRCSRLRLRSALGEDVVFDVESFLLIQEPHDVPFFRALTSTQSFSAFVTSCMQEMA